MRCACGVATHARPTEDEARDEWNKRAPATPPTDAELDALCEKLARKTTEDHGYNGLYEVDANPDGPAAIEAINRLRIAREVDVERVADALRGPINDFGYAARLAVARAAIAAMTGEKSNG